MPINVQCPRCGGMFAVSDDMAGRQVTCQCGQPISVLAAGGAYQGGFQQPDQYGRARSGGAGGGGGGFNPYASPLTSGGAQWIMSGSPALRVVANGLGLVLIALMLLILAFLSVFVLPFMIGVAAVWVILLMMLGSGVCSLVGYIMCLVVPPESGSKPLIIVAVVLSLVAIALALLTGVGALPDGVGVVANLAGLASFVCFVLFMRTLSSYIGRNDLATDASSVLVIGGIMLALSIISLVLTFAMGPRVVRAAGGDGGQVFFCMLAIAQLVLLIWFLIKYIGLLGSLRSALLRQ